VTSSGSRPPKPEELIAAATIAAVLSIPVTQHDDGTSASMYDLDLNYPGRQPVPAEVTIATDDVLRSTLGFIGKNDADAWSAPDLGRDWSLHTEGGPPMRKLMGDAHAHLRLAEEAFIEVLDDGIAVCRAVEWRYSGRSGSDPIVEAWQALRGMGVIRAMSHALSDETAEIRVHVQLGGGSWDGSADCVSSWIGTVAADPKRADNIKKLANAEGEAHLVVFADIAGVEWSVWRALVDHYGTGVLPTIDPLLPAPITHVWIFPVWGGATVLAWSTEGWRRVPLVWPADL
jgi:hypothetical protein